MSEQVLNASMYETRNESVNSTQSGQSFGESLLTSTRNYISEHVSDLIIAAIIILAGAIAIKIFSSIVQRFFARTNYDRTVELFIERVLGAFLWAILILLVLSNFGVNVTAFIAGLGALGFIVGFATRDVFSNLAAGLLLLINKPFRVGDDIDAAGVRGIVQELNMSFTVLVAERNLYIAVPNSRIWGGPIKNFTRLASAKSTSTKRSR